MNVSKIKMRTKLRNVEENYGNAKILNIVRLYRLYFLVLLSGRVADGPYHIKNIIQLYLQAAWSQPYIIQI